MKITIEYNPSPAPSVTGAALRAVQAADRQAEAVAANIRAQAARLEAVLQQTEPSATLLAEGFRALQAYVSACDGMKALTVRNRAAIKIPNNIPTDSRIAPYTTYITSIIPRAADRYRDQLANAGIPMPEAGVYTPEYWDDAAARGC